jgi:hypothetical protein
MLRENILKLLSVGEQKSMLDGVLAYRKHSHSFVCKVPRVLLGIHADILVPPNA